LSIPMVLISFCSLVVSMEPMNTLPFGQTNITFNNGHYANCPNHHNKWLLHICELNSMSSQLPIWTHPFWILLTNLCAIHGMMGVCSRFHFRTLLSQFLWMLGVTQHCRGCSLHKRKLPTSCPNLVLWLNSIPQAMKPIERFKCCYLCIY
jgi:hypothetical protein